MSIAITIFRIAIYNDLASLRSQLVIGESYTTGETFDSVSIRGIRLQ